MFASTPGVQGHVCTKGNPQPDPDSRNVGQPPILWRSLYCGRGSWGPYRPLFMETPIWYFGSWMTHHIKLFLVLERWKCPAKGLPGLHFGLCSARGRCFLSTRYPLPCPQCSTWYFVRDPLYVVQYRPKATDQSRFIRDPTSSFNRSPAPLVSRSESGSECLGSGLWNAEKKVKNSVFGALD